MSAWIVSKEHIDALVQALAEGEIVVDVEPTEIGRTLWRENLYSIWARYPDTKENDADYPGPVDFSAADVENYVYARPRPALASGALLKQANCYEYQTCEHDGWNTSRARAWIDMLVTGLEHAGFTHVSPAYAAAPWGV